MVVTGSVLIIVAQMVYDGFSQVADPLSMYARRFATFSAISVPPAASDSAFYLAIVFIALLTLLGTWWFGLLVAEQTS